MLAIAFACYGCVKQLQDGNTNENPSQGSSEKDPPQEQQPDNNNPPQEQQPDDNPPLWATDFNLPDADSALAKLVEIYGGEDKLFLLLKNKITRMPCPQGEVVTINATFDVGEYAKLILEDSIAEFNEVFAVINPNYKFAINYHPTEDDLAQKYSVRLSISDNLAVTETSEVFGLAHVSYYNNYTELGNFGITIKTEVFNNGSYLVTTFKHELMHLLGAGDAYKNSAATLDTVMQNYRVNGYHHFSATDVAFLDALYRNPQFADDDRQILAYINAYEQNCTHTKTVLTAAVYDKLVANLDAQAVIDQALAIGYKDLTDLTNTVSGGIPIDPTFGTVNISFAELEYAEPQSETYFGGINAQTGKYTHGRQRSSMRTSQELGCVIYGNGIVYAAPNGSQYTIMVKTGDFVLTLHLGGSFTDLPELSLTLWHVCK